MLIGFQTELENSKLSTNLENRGKNTNSLINISLLRVY